MRAATTSNAGEDRGRSPVARRHARAPALGTTGTVRPGADRAAGPQADDAVAQAEAIEQTLAEASVRIGEIHHGDGIASWAANRRAAARRHGIRTSLKDTPVLPDGRTAAGNAELIAAARALIARPRDEPTGPDTHRQDCPIGEWVSEKPLQKPVRQLVGGITLLRAPDPEFGLGERLRIERFSARPSHRH